MKLFLLLLLALLAPSSVSPADIGNNAEQRNDQVVGADVTTDGSVVTDQAPSSSSFTSNDGSNLEWVTWNNSLPNNSVSIYNGYTGRTEYVCKYLCEAGFYSPSEGLYCHYATTKKAYSGFPFEILVNKDNFEILEWQEDSHGSVPQNSVRTCPGVDIYVGQNKYGLGKVFPKERAFYLPWKDSEYWYTHYQVLTINENIVNQKIYDVKYNTDASTIFHYPPEIMRKTVISNFECSPVVKTDTLTTTSQVEKKWDVTFSVTVGVTTTFSVSIPFITKDGIQFSTEVSFQYSKGNTVTDTMTDTITVEITAPPNHSCTATMERYKYKINIPFTARISRTYGNGVTNTMIITGTYNSVQVAQLQAVMGRCEILDSSNPCT